MRIQLYCKEIDMTNWSKCPGRERSGFVTILLLSVGSVLFIAAAASCAAEAPASSGVPLRDHNATVTAMGLPEPEPMINQTKTVPPGKWGGNGISVDVGRGSVTIEYPCANGEIKGPLKVDGGGNFSVTGVHIMSKPGPVRKDGSQERRPARFVGRIEGKTMKLKVFLTENDEAVGDFELKKDAPARIKRCM
jgi:hypothetical protein